MSMHRASIDANDDKIRFAADFVGTVNDGTR